MSAGPPGRHVREQLLERLIRDLVGPDAEGECLADRPTDRYLTGLLYPQEARAGAEEDENIATDGDADTEDSADTQVSMATTMRPASMGLSFAAACASGTPEVDVEVSCARYEFRANDNEAHQDDPDAGADRPDQDVSSACWQRIGCNLTLKGVTLDPGHRGIPLAQHDAGMAGLELYIQTSSFSDGLLATVALVNRNRINGDDGRREIIGKTWFQTCVSITPCKDTTLPPKPPRAASSDEDARSAALIYRDAHEFAVGHTCSAVWESVDGRATKVATAWIPSHVVPETSAKGHRVLQALTKRADGNPLSAGWLTSAPDSKLAAGLAALADAYSGWISSERQRIPTIPQHLRTQAGRHLDICEEGAQRMRGGAALIATNAEVRRAFRLANLAILTQRQWSDPACTDFEWRPFQLGFILLSLVSVADRTHDERAIMDLLWFPTGGGKTEAYLGLTAFTLFHRRLSAKTPEQGVGVAVIMRYTLRLLTIQQFQRAAALILACEHLRLTGAPGLCDAGDLGVTPFSLGLWVGASSTPNKFDEAANALANGSHSTPAQLTSCPCCGGPLRWYADRNAGTVRPTCRGKKCDLAAAGTLPILTVDEDIYREQPSLLIGTVDKFTQITRRTDIGQLFGRSTGQAPPDLIIQDELHLISGPLGTLTGLYEIVVDELCSRDGVRPKIIGSTATIRRASEQIRQLFDRETYQFPAPGLDAASSCFAEVDRESSGRLYAGITTAGRSPKFSLQAACASLLQGAADPALTDDERDPYWTLVAYFNSLRELGGALVQMHDDVPDSIRLYAGVRGEEERNAEVIEELTSRVSSAEIPRILEDLGITVTAGDALDIVLASNMISVGVDVGRLGLMVVNGQPKGIAEYIQATSRVGRGKVPGLVLTVYNSGKTRDRAHFETFNSWHGSLYRDVEAGSVTPFAPRARDRALHAVLVALARHLVPGLGKKPLLNPTTEQQVRQLFPILINRVRSCDSGEEQATADALDRAVGAWVARTSLERYWDDRHPDRSLLISAEKDAANRAAGLAQLQAWPTPNSMRNVEPSSRFVMIERLSTNHGGTGNAEE
ncbi:helicase-related protein [Imhoffiella purpurea]|uniref:Superfamily II DNA and RNA helicase n=1 Tax=Imhoffiella purpurea TaxID=1249627 RepID=W9VT73_9GAMM|nr:helicase-related protein [Imhoffiella purpurea]EXJ13585.1 Superfamily II DNA and RNA helicase [Imhoffiella purpurea]